MKRCPECRRAYYDETLTYCLDDGTALVYGPRDSDSSATAILDVAPSEAPTRLRRTDVTKEAAADGSKRKLIFIAGILLLTFAAGIVYRTFVSNSQGGSFLPTGLTVTSQPQIKSL